MKLTKKQKEYIYEILYKSEVFPKRYINLAWHVEPIDWEENYCGGVNVYPYAIYITKTKELVDCVDQDFMNDLYLV